MADRERTAREVGRVLYFARAQTTRRTDPQLPRGNGGAPFSDRCETAPEPADISGTAECPGLTRFAGAGLPLPHAVDDFLRQAMAELASNQNQLPAMMRLVRDEVVEKVHQVGREVLPVGRRH